ncbi:hypothetical protein [Aureimonas sp. AU4]|uniref:hypothetical protein n=1 Tax=Aureimonas sp. AU4 TaxID=1638163 RepID=UPI0007059FBA|nr:hypothetical protein [Aureimonas sp. AU4]BAT30653.1 hypothetical protein [Aureimonas sp. AU4]
MPLSFKSTRVPHLRIVVERFPGLHSLEMRDAIATLAEKRLRRLRMDLEDKANAILLPMPS